jgi:hypothetical protein
VGREESHQHRTVSVASVWWGVEKEQGFVAIAV